MALRQFDQIVAWASVLSPETPGRQSAVAATLSLLLRSFDV
jgi:hypothetical protein